MKEQKGSKSIQGMSESDKGATQKTKKIFHSLHFNTTLAEICWCIISKIVQKRVARFKRVPDFGDIPQ